jgi:hypothetical protein
MIASAAAFPLRLRLRPHAGSAPARRYERRRPEKTRLHRIVSENLESWLEWRDRAERPVPGHVKEELRGYLECGILCFGFARALCTGCGQGFVVAFSCKGRGVCPSCNGRHMAQTAAHLADLLRYCARPPFALERLSVIRGPAGRITQVCYVLPRHKAANWVGRACERRPCHGRLL